MRSSFRFAALAAAALLSTVDGAGAQTVDDIVAKNIAAKGGVDLIRQTTNVRMTGRFTTYPPAGMTGRPPTEMAMTTWAKRPNLMRQETTMTPPAAEAPGAPARPAAPSTTQKMVRASDGSTIWMQMGASPPQALPSAQAEPMMQDVEFDSVFVDYKTRGITIALVGRQALNGREVYHLTVSRKNGPVQNYYLDAETMLETKVSTKVSQGGSSSLVETEIADYRTVDGRTVPFKTRQLVDAQLAAEMTFETIEFNVAMPDSLFRMPIK
jgi:hypothetical protein